MSTSRGCRTPWCTFAAAAKSSAAGQLRRHTERVGGRGRSLVAQHDVERVGGHVFLREINHQAVGSGRDRRGDDRMRQLGRDQALELGHELVQALRRHVEPQDFDRDQPRAIGIVGTKDRTERSGTDLMQDPERSERVRRRGAGSFRMQWDNSSGRRSDRNTTIRFGE